MESPNFSFRHLQNEVLPWQERNFPNTDAVLAALGACEEMGEVARAVTKMHEGIRGTRDEWLAEAEKEIGDVAIKRAQVSNLLGIDFEDAVLERWALGPDPIRDRDWTEDKLGHGLPQENK